MPDTDPRATQVAAYDVGLVDEIERNVDAMLAHATARGLPVPGWSVNAYAKVKARRDDVRGRIAAEGASPSLEEVRRAVADDLRTLARVHEVLAELVHPATPETLRAEDDGQRLVWQTMVLGGALLVVYLALTGSGGAAAGGLGAVALRATAAGLGAAFYNLRELQVALGKGTFDPRRPQAAWTRMALGVIAGVVLSDETLGLVPGPTDGDGMPFSVSLLALLGGFSADAVHEVLQRVVDAVKALVSGSADARVAAELDVQKAQLHTRVAAERLAVARELLSMQERLEEGLDEATRERLRRLVDELAGDLPKA